MPETSPTLHRSPTGVSLYPDDSEWKQLGAVAKTVFQSKKFDVPSEAAAATVLLTGRELGLPPIFSLLHLHFISNKPSLDGIALGALLIRGRALYKFNENWGDTPQEQYSECTIIRKELDMENTIRFSMADAQRANLLNKNNWKAYPRAMLRWRSLSECAKITCPDLIGGMGIPDEYGAITDDQGVPTGDFVQVEYIDAETVGEEAANSISGSPKETPETAPETAPEPSEAPISEDTGSDPPSESPPEQPVQESGTDVKKLAQNIHINWAKRMSALGTAIDKKLSKEEQDAVLVTFLRENGVDTSKCIGDDGKVHLSSVDPTKLQLIKTILEHPGMMDKLKGLYAATFSDTGIEETEEKKEEPEPPKQEQTQQVDPEKNADSLKEKLREKVGFDGIAIYVEACRKQGITGETGESITQEQWKGVNSTLSSAYAEIMQGKDSQAILSELRG